jgi:hypothetical protein
MNPSYRHTQVSQLQRWVSFLPAIGLVIAGRFTQEPTALLPIVAVIGGAGWVFSSLTIEVTETELTWFFSSGVWRERIKRDEIVSAIAARDKWWWGWGVHRTPRGWLYNVAGLDAVEIALRDGRTLRLGIDQPAALIKALSPV